MTPGPGQYQVKTYMGKDAPKITMSARPQTSGEREYLPGPGQYNFSSSNRPKSPSYRMGSAKRDGINSNKLVPGPGSYTPNLNTISMRPKSPNWSMGSGQRTVSFPDLVPGPGNYNTSKGLGNGPKVI
jgi:hypothetical protein